jgi:regulatory protein
MQIDKKLYTQALKFLAKRARSTAEVRDNLLKVKAPEEQIQLIINLLTQQKFLDDMQFAQWWIEQRMLLRPKGWYVLEQELRQKGIPDDILKGRTQ